MNSTLDNINNNILKKIDSVRQIISVLMKHKLTQSSRQILISCEKDIENLYIVYELGTIKILENYYNHINKRSNVKLKNTNVNDSNLDKPQQKLTKLEETIDKMFTSGHLFNDSNENPKFTKTLSDAALNMNTSNMIKSLNFIKNESINYLKRNDISDLDRKMAHMFISTTEIQEKKIESFDLDLKEYFSDINTNHNVDQYNTNRNSDKNDYIKYIKFLEQNNILNNLKHIYKKCKIIFSINKISDIIVDKLICQIDNISIDIHINNDNITQCKLCNIPYTTDRKNNEYYCHKCNVVEKIYGVVFEDEQFFYQEGQRTKHGKYEPTKHCKFWIDRILAKECVELPEKLINNIKKCIKRDNIRLEQLSCEDIRTYLKELKMTFYNNDVSLICKEITKKEPEQLTERELRLLYMYFNKIIQIFDMIKPENKLICSYYPYFIYKIIEHILKDKIHEKRKKSILSRIHLQSRDTLNENDNIMKTICKYIKDFKYIPTEKS